MSLEDIRKRQQRWLRDPKPERGDAQSPALLEEIRKRTKERKDMIKEEFSHLRPDAVHRQVLEELLEEMPGYVLKSVADEIERERAHRAEQIELFGSPDYWMEK